MESSNLINDVENKYTYDENIINLPAPSGYNLVYRFFHFSRYGTMTFYIC